MKRAFSHILEPIITEKSTALSKQNQYTFQISKSTTKHMIREEFSKIFPDRKIKSIKVLKLKGHTRRTKKGIKFPIDNKKAIIKVDGPKIEYFPDVT